MTHRIGSHRVGVVDGEVSLLYDDLVPSSAPIGTIVLVHGGCLSGSCYLVTPDGRPGWTDDFLGLGYRVVVPDWPGVGRSSGTPSEDVTGEVVVTALGELLEELGERVVLLVHSMSGPYGFRLSTTHAPYIRALVAAAPGPPGELQAVPDPVRDEEGGGWVFAQDGSTMSVAGSGLFPLTADFARSKMIGASTQFPGGVEALLRMSAPTPVGCVLDRVNFRGRQLRLDDDVDLAGLPLLVLTGESDSDHAVETDARVADRLRDLGAAVDHYSLPEHGHRGNGHLLMSEKNSSEIAALIGRWIETTVTSAGAPPAPGRG